MARRILPALAGLLQAYAYARDVESTAWEFALDLRDLERAGLNRSDLRWLLRKGLLEQGRDVTTAEDSGRVVRKTSSPLFSSRSCFVLTPRGATYFGQLREAVRNRGKVRRSDGAHHSPSGSTSSRPRWDRDRQELRVGGEIVKQFKVPAPNQEMILAAFEEEGWPPRIDDPLPPLPLQDPKRRLHDTINSLNRNHRAARIRFLGDGSGQGIRWEGIDP